MSNHVMRFYCKACVLYIQNSIEHYSQITFEIPSAKEGTADVNSGKYNTLIYICLKYKP